MRIFSFLMASSAVALVAALSGCPDPGLDLGDPPADCATRPPAKITVAGGDGTGAREADAGFLLSSGFQGGDHVWIAVTAENLGPLVLIEPAVRDQQGNVLSEDALSAIYPLDQYLAPDGGPGPVNVQGRLKLGGSALIGQTLTISAKVTDACPHSASGQASGVVVGYDEDQGL